MEQEILVYTDDTHEIEIPSCCYGLYETRQFISSDFISQNDFMF